MHLLVNELQGLRYSGTDKDVSNVKINNRLEFSLNIWHLNGVLVEQCLVFTFYKNGQ